MKMRLIVTKRVKPLKFGGIIIPFLSIVVGIFLATIALYGLARVPPLLVYGAIGQSLISPQMLQTFVMLTILGVALIIPFNAAVWNIGAEGQIIWGMIMSAFIGLTVAVRYIIVSPSDLPKYTNMPGMFVLPTPTVSGAYAVEALTMNPGAAICLMLIVAGIAGAVWALIAGLMRAYLDIDEVATTLIMNYIAYYAYNYIVYGPLQGITISTSGFGLSNALHPALRFSRISTATTATWEGVALMIAIFAIAWFVLKQTTFGLRLRILGSNPQVLRAAGINVRKYIVLALTISGAIAGLVGTILFAGNLYQLIKIKTITTPPTHNIGYTAILVSWLSMLDIRGVPIAAYIVASLFQAGINLQSSLGGVSGGSAMISSGALTYVLIGFVLTTFTVLRVFAEYSIKVVREGR